MRVCHEAHGPYLKSLLELRWRGGGHDWIVVYALLWIDHVEIRLLLCRIKAVWAMRQVRGVVVIVMVHEVSKAERACPVQGTYKKREK